MATPPPRLAGTAEWQALEAHHGAVAPLHLRDLFAGDPARGETLRVNAGDPTLPATRARSDRAVVLADRAGARLAHTPVQS